jgi:hypothetical protein
LGFFGLSFALQPMMLFAGVSCKLQVSVFVRFLWLELCLAALMMLFAGISCKLQVSVFVGFRWLELYLAALMMLFAGVSSKLQVSAYDMSRMVTEIIYV